ncbi:MAG: DUF1830 domain-containing protein [Cyanobium sp.]
MPTANPLPLSMETATPEAFFECGYRNSSDRMVILRCLGCDAFFLERVVFPFELLSFTCPPDSEVEILTHSLGGPELLETMPADTLRIDGGSEPGDAAPLSDMLSMNPWLQAS